jgi:outer membrane protein assembly factor BamB
VARSAHPRPLAAGALAVLAALCITRAAAADWPSFRGPGASGLGTGATVTEWDVESGANLLWKTPIPGLGHSSPVIWGDRIFVTTAVPETGTSSLKVGLYGDIAAHEDGRSHAFKLLAVDRGSGELLWERVAHVGVPRVKRHLKASHANPTPATDGERVVAFFGSEGLYAYDLDGELLWKKDLGVLDSGYFQVPTAQWGFASSPILHDGKVIVQVDIQQGSFIAAFDAADGRELWRTPREEVPTWSTPAVVPYSGGEQASMQVVANGWKHIGGYDLETGRELWKLSGGGDIPVPTPVHADGRIVITSAHGAQRPIYVLDTGARGEISTDDPAMLWWEQRAGNYMQTPLLHGGLGYFCLDNGVFSIFDMASGKRLVQQRLGGGGGFTASPVAADGKLYITSEQGATHVLGLGREYAPLAVNELGETVMSTPAIADGVLYFRARHHLFAIGARPAEPATVPAD